MCDFYFSFQQNDVSTLKQEDDNCKDQLKINELIDSRKHEDRLLTCVENLKKKIDN